MELHFPRRFSVTFYPHVCPSSLAPVETLVSRDSLEGSPGPEGPREPLGLIGEEQSEGLGVEARVGWSTGPTTLDVPTGRLRLVRISSRVELPDVIHPRGPVTPPVVVERGRPYRREV